MHKPRVGELFWVEDRQGDDAFDKGSQCNGKIICVDWDEFEVTVRFLDFTTMMFPLDDLEDHYSTAHGGIYRYYKGET